MLLEEFGFEDVRDYVTGKQDWISRGLTVEGEEADKLTVGVMAVDPPLLGLDMAPSNAVSLIDHHEGSAGVIVADGGTVVGLLSRDAADKAQPGAAIDEIMDPGPKTYRADAEPRAALEFMDKNGLDQVLVTDPLGKLIGALYRDTVQEMLSAEEGES
ncbi:MAG TPA: CBS domain-containing protein [Thermomicrobiales bacterium]|nr:CBS domain-containing protein [Thermomicrobiales bacterium]